MSMYIYVFIYIYIYIYIYICIYIYISYIYISVRRGGHPSDMLVDKSSARDQPCVLLSIPGGLFRLVPPSGRLEVGAWRDTRPSQVFFSQKK